MSGGAETGRRWWRSLEQYADSEAFAEAFRAEFPSLFEQWRVDRREVLRVMGASLALAGVSGCKPARSDQAVPFVTQPEGFDESRIEHFATAIIVEGFAQPVLATAYAGRPIKLEGNPQHPASGGACSFLTQAALLDLYDPDRSQAPLMRGDAVSWATFDAQMALLRAQWGKTGGAAVRLLLGPTTSPTLIAQIEQLKAALPNVRVHLFDPLGGYGPDPAAAAFGAPAQQLLHLERARAVVSLDNDFLGPGPAQVPNARGWAKRRGEVAAAERIRLFMAEPTPTLTGAMAQTRIAVPPSRMALLAAAIAAKCGVGASVGGLSPAEFGWVNAAADALLQNRGASLLTVGRHAPPQLHALGLKLNQALGNTDKTLSLVQPATLVPDGTFLDLVREIEAGQVAALFMIGANPVYAAPGDVDFAGLMKRVPATIHAGLHLDETAVRSDWHLPLPHALEDWSDARSVDGTATIVQPLIQPLYDIRSPHTILAGFTTDGTPPDARSIVRGYWAQNGLADEPSWNQAVQLGLVAGTQSKPATAAAAALPAATLRRVRAGEIEIVIRPDPTIRDGAHANNGWLQELPKPLLKTTWDNVVAISPAMARSLGVGDADMVEVQSNGRKIEGPAWLLPGHPDGVATVYLGYGRSNAGRVAEGIGYNAYLIRSAAEPWATSGTIRKTGAHSVIATTQAHNTMEEGPVVRTVATADTAIAHPAQQSIYPGWPQDEPKWGMVIDLDLCIGCNACVTACQAENNVPVVGKKQVYAGREMFWLRVDRYYSGPPETPTTAFQPVPCMQCEQAPCEMGCPVHATVHSPDGINLMVYNRCIGTRTCSSYCPYKVRRFNWFDYTTEAPRTIQAQRNPDVTVRGRGVMEKCTYCIQRIRGAAVEADKENRAIREGEVLTACQQACPTTAIVFGNLADGGSAVARRRSRPRNYALLEELGTRPRTTYLARIGEEA